jgi:hypothetical protein
MSEIWKELEKTKKMGSIYASKLKPFKNGGQSRQAIKKLNWQY